MDFLDHLSEALQIKADSYDVVVQIIQDGGWVHIYLNRPSGTPPNCPELVEILKATMQKDFREISSICFYSRVYGEELPDWEAEYLLGPDLEERSPDSQTENLLELDLQEKVPEWQTENLLELDLDEELPDWQGENLLELGLEEELPDWQGENLLELDLEATKPSLVTSQVLPKDLAKELPETNKNTVPSTPQSSLPTASSGTGKDTTPVISESVTPLKEQELGIEEAPKELNLQSFCFNRNRQLVTGEVDNPSTKVAETIHAFHEWEQDKKQMFLLFLDDWFKNSKSVQEHISQLPQDCQTLLSEMTADSELQRSIKLWLSRYCHDPEAAMSQVNATLSFSQNPKLTPDNISVASDRIPTSTQTSSSSTISQPIKKSGVKQVSNASQTTNKSSVKPGSNPKSQSFSGDEILVLLATAVFVGGLSWLLSGLVSRLGIIGLFIAVFAIAGGLASVFGQKVIGSICSFILFIFWLIFGFFGGFGGLLLIGYEFVGGMIGVVTGVAVKMAVSNSKSVSIFAPKPLRIIITAAFVLILILGQAFFSAGSNTSNFGNRNRGEILVGYNASGLVSYESKTFTPKGAIAIWDEFNKELRISILPIGVSKDDLQDTLSYLKDEGEDRSTTSFPAKYLADISDSYDPKQFPVNPAVQLDILFAKEPTPSSYNLSVAIPISKDSTVFPFKYCTAFPCDNPIEGLKISSFEPKEGGSLRLSLDTLIVKAGEQPTNVNLQIDSKVNLKT
jgi:hypothetical protein